MHSPTVLTYVPKMLLVSFESVVFGHLAQEKAHTLNIKWNSAAQGSKLPALKIHQ